MKKYLFLILILFVNSFSIEFLKDSINDYHSDDDILLINLSEDTVFIDSIYIHRVYGETAFELYFEWKSIKQSELNTSWIDFNYLNDSVLVANDYFVINFKIKISPYDTLILSHFMHGSCMFCISDQFIAGNFGITVIFYASNSTSDSFYLSGDLASIYTYYKINNSIENFNKINGFYNIKGKKINIENRYNNFEILYRKRN